MAAVLRELVLGAMPQGADPSTHIASGPWCFTGQEELFPRWWDVFPLPPDPFTTAEDLECTAKAANGEVCRQIELVQKELNAQFGVEYSSRFWGMLMGPWLLLFIHMLAERQKRVLDLVVQYGDEPLLVPVLPAECSFFFETTQDFMLNGVQARSFNHYIFSRIVESVAPPHWQLQPLPQASVRGDGKVNPEKGIEGAASGLRGALKAGLRNLRFPRQKGFSLAQCLAFSVPVALNRSADKTLPLEAYTGTPFPWHFAAADLLWRCVPLVIKKLRCLPAPARSKNKLRGMTAAISQDDMYRLALAAWLEGGGRLFSVQHGANYGNLLSMGGVIFEYAQHAFVAWGWDRHQGYPVNALPLPQPALVRAYAHGKGRQTVRSNAPEKYGPEAGSLIIVGTEMSPFAYRLKTRPHALEQVRYRQGKVDFVNALPGYIRSQAQYRPYFAVAGGLDDAAFMQRQTTLPLCEGNLQEKMENCRLLVLDHYGTTLHMAYAANIPTLAFWNPKAWAMEPASARAVDVLAKAGMVVSTPLEAAARVAAMWESIDTWWFGDEVQEARHLWLSHYAECRGFSAAKVWACWIKGLLGC